MCFSHINALESCLGAGSTVVTCLNIWLKAFSNACTFASVLRACYNSMSRTTNTGALPYRKSSISPGYKRVVALSTPALQGSASNGEYRARRAMNRLWLNMSHVTRYICIQRRWCITRRFVSPTKSMRERLIISIVIVNSRVIARYHNVDNKAQRRPAPSIDMFT